jgi:hypothetical protein
MPFEKTKYIMEASRILREAQWSTLADAVDELLEENRALRRYACDAYLERTGQAVESAGGCDWPRGRCCLLIGDKRAPDTSDARLPGPGNDSL